MTSSKVLENYNNLINIYSGELIVVKKKSKIVSIIRLIVFVSGLIIFYYLLKASLLQISIFTLVWIVVFLILLRLSVKYKNKIKYLKIILDINKNEIDAINLNQKYFNNGKNYIDKTHYFSFDLDIFGENSIFKLINRTVTKSGEHLLVDWFNNQKLLAEEILKKQKIVKELAGQINFRQEFITTALLDFKKLDSFDKIILWVNKSVNDFNKKWVNYISKILVLINILILIFSISGTVNYSFFIISFLINLFFEGFYIKQILKSHNELTQATNNLKNYSLLLKLIENNEFVNSELVDFKNKLKFNNQKASTVIKKLFDLNNYLDSSKNILLGVILNGMFLWDLNFIIELEKFKKKYSNKLADWFNVISEFDALISLSTFVYNFPEFTMPKIVNDNEFVLKATNIAHPLIDASKRVSNDFEVSKFSEIKIITGANMAGKSTFLRTIGVNIFLSYLGLPVCADNFEVSKVKLFTSMRTSDNLAKNTSYFHAELLRLSVLNDELKANEKLFIILDEILKGTNSVDKEKGSRAFLEKIINYNVSGIVATHDLSLGNLENEYPKNFINNCFEVDFNNDDIVFDYKLRKGVSSKMNAYFLMQKMKLI